MPVVTPSKVQSQSSCVGVANPFLVLKLCAFPGIERRKFVMAQVLEKAYERLGRRPVVYKMNPKAMARQQLLGSMNLDTREWSDGVLTAAARKVRTNVFRFQIAGRSEKPFWKTSLSEIADSPRGAEKQI